MISVRPALTADIPRVVELNDALFREDAGQHDSTLNLGWAREHGDAYFSRFLNTETGIIFLAEMDGDARVVGYLAGYLKLPTEYRLLTSAELESIYVVPDLRAKGVGKELARTFLYWCRAKGAERITVTAYSANSIAIAFYQALGFIPKHTSLELKLG